MIYELSQNGCRVGLFSTESEQGTMQPTCPTECTPSGNGPPRASLWCSTRPRTRCTTLTTEIDENLICEPPKRTDTCDERIRGRRPSMLPYTDPLSMPGRRQPPGCCHRHPREDRQGNDCSMQKLHKASIHGVSGANVVQIRKQKRQPTDSQLSFSTKVPRKGLEPSHHH